MDAGKRIESWKGRRVWFDDETSHWLDFFVGAWTVYVDLYSLSVHALVGLKRTVMREWHRAGRTKHRYNNVTKQPSDQVENYPSK